MRFCVFLLALSLSFSLPAAGKKDALAGELTIFHAGSLSVPFKEISDAFIKIHPGLKINLESAGSRQCARKITELNKPCDVMASSDFTVIDSLLIPDYAEWNIKFAANEMAIVYHQNSRMSQVINEQNWYRFLQMKTVAFGRADPDSDPCGYRSVIVMKLAELYYKTPGLTESLLKKDIRYIRPKEVDLLSLLEANEIDYIFLYKSVALQHKLKYISLPDEINLKSPKFIDLYASVSTEISGTEPGSKTLQKGDVMTYGVTIPKNAPNPVAALAFVDFLLGKKGMAIMEKNGQPGTVPSVSETYTLLPESLKKYALPVTK
ncbi:MAG: extracellular solute-binding protein [Candidatus Wallbacteria bacterium]|nr:extracellular solute-binding protein [Candidatus Wallbacteria bacterium]